MTAIAQASEIPARQPFTERFFHPIAIFFRALRRNRAGLIGFIGLVAYALWIFIAPIFVPFDSKVRLDQIAAPPGSRDQLLVRAEDASRYTSLTSLAGKTVGVVQDSGGEDIVAPYANDLTINRTRWRSGQGIGQSLDKLAEGEIDALVIFSEQVKAKVTNNPKYADLVVSNSSLGAPHILGTDTQGRDIFSHIINGGGSLIMTAVLAGLFSTIIAVALGALAALVGGIVDTLLTAAANFVLTIPSFPLLIVLASLIRLDSVFLLAFLIAALSWPVLMRAIRSQVLSLSVRD
jgi:ABC-type dipeptide/oligopeptide/nickel transport system permease subunit